MHNEYTPTDWWYSGLNIQNISFWTRCKSKISFRKANCKNSFSHSEYSWETGHCNGLPNIKKVHTDKGDFL